MAIAIGTYTQRQFIAALVSVVLVLAWFAVPARAQDVTARLDKPALEQLVAPIALYPDSLVSQILMASTYPLEVVEAQRWVKAHRDVTGDTLQKAMEGQTWDPSVKSLTAFPDVLDMMNDELSWTQQLGDAFLAQQEDVLATVQNLRERADAEGKLTSTKEQKVEKQTVTAASGAKQSVIVIEPVNPQVVYVPYYDPAVVYGPWPYPAYPPYYWYPPGYVAGRSLFWFAAGVAVGNALWGRCDWGRRSVTINVNTYNRYNYTRITSNKWTHNAVHRKGVPYRNRDVANRYGKGRNDARARARDQYRGRAESGRRDLAAHKPKIDRKGPRGPGKRPDAKRPGAKHPETKRPSAKRPAAKQRPKVAKRPPQARRPAAVKRPSTRKATRPKSRPAAFKHVGSGHKARAHSARGKSSRHASRSRGGGGRGGGRRR